MIPGASASGDRAHAGRDPSWYLDTPGLAGVVSQIPQISVARLRAGERMVRLVVRDRETIQEAVRRFRKLVERSGIKKEMRRREHYEKPSETKRRARLRAERRARRTRLLADS